MSEPKKRTRENIKLAAQLRAEGRPWAEVAPEIGRKTEESARQLPFEYPDLWTVEYQRACDHFLAEDSIKARLTQCELLSPTLDAYDKHGNLMQNPDGSPMQIPNDPTIRQRAAHSIMSQAMKLRAQRIELTKGRSAHTPISDEELEQLIRADLEVRKQETFERQEQEEGQGQEQAEADADV